MNLARTDRALTAWMLFASVLFSLFACGLHHGQMSGQSLSGLNGGFCSVESGNGAAVDLGHSDQSQQAASLACPLKSSRQAMPAPPAMPPDLPVSLWSYCKM